MPTEVLRDEGDHGDEERCDGIPEREVVDFKMMLQDDGASGWRINMRGNKGFDTAARSMYPTKPGWVLPTSRSAPLIPLRPRIDTSKPDRTESNAVEAALSASSSSSSSDSQFPLSPALGQIDLLDTQYLTTTTQRHAGGAEDMDIYSALRWSKSGRSVMPTYPCKDKEGAPQLPPIPKMIDLMDGLFTTYSTPEREEGRHWANGMDTHGMSFVMGRA